MNPHAPTPPLSWRDWGGSAALHGALLAALAWGVTHSPARPSPPTRLDMTVTWEAERPPAPALKPPPAPTPPAIVPRPRPRAQQAPAPSAPPAPPVTPVAPPSPNAVVTSADTVVPAAPTAPAPATEGHRATTPAVTAAIAPSPSQQAAQAARWRGLLEAALLQHKHYPLVARRMRQEGLVTVEAHFSSTGELLQCVVISGSGFKALDEAALHLVRQAADLVRVTHQPGRVAQLRIPIAYELKES